MLHEKITEWAFKEALCHLTEDIQTQNLNIYNMNEVIFSISK